MHYRISEWKSDILCIKLGPTSRLESSCLPLHIPSQKKRERSKRQSDEGSKDLGVIHKATTKSDSPNKALTVELLELYPEEKDPDKKTLEEGTLKARLPDLGVEIKNMVYKVYEEKNIVILAPARNRTRKKKKVAISDFVFTDEAVWLSILKNLRKQIVEARKKNEAAKIPNEREAT